MIEKKVSREQFTNLISDFLVSTGLEFKQDNESWTLERIIPGGVVQVAINGKPTQIQQDSQTVQFKVEVVGQGDVRDAGASEPGDEFLQIHFSVSQNGEVVRSFEDCIYMQNSIEQFKNTFIEIFR